MAKIKFQQIENGEQLVLDVTSANNAATSASQTASAAQQTATSASQTASAAQQTATSASQTASAAQQTAETANTAASSAKTKADALEIQLELATAEYGGTSKILIEAGDARIGQKTIEFLPTVMFNGSLRELRTLQVTENGVFVSRMDVLATRNAKDVFATIVATLTNPIAEGDVFELNYVCRGMYQA